MAKRSANRYEQIIERIFLEHYTEGAEEVDFPRDDIDRVAKQLNVSTPSNVGDLVYSFRYRVVLPESVRAKAPLGKDWIIRPVGRSQYRFVARERVNFAPSGLMAETRIPDATPGIIAMYALGDEQALLAKIRYNRLIDIFTGVTCYSLQSHMRTTVPGIGQVETDEVYIGIDQRGVHYVFPVQAKAGREQLGIVQIEQDFALCESKFPSLVCRPIGAQFMEKDLIALFEFVSTENGVAFSTEKHYRLVPAEDLSPEEILSYRSNQA